CSRIVEVHWARLQSGAAPGRDATARTGAHSLAGGGCRDGIRLSRSQVPVRLNARTIGEPTDKWNRKITWTGTVEGGERRHHMRRSVGGTGPVPRRDRRTDPMGAAAKGLRAGPLDVTERAVGNPPRFPPGPAYLRMRACTCLLQPPADPS